MKMRIGMSYGLVVLFPLALSVAPLTMWADLISPFRLLHRVGFEELAKVPQNTEPALSPGEPAIEVIQLTEAEEKDLQKKAEELKELFNGKSELDLGGGKIVRYEDLLRDMRRQLCERKELAGELQRLKGAWKCQRDVSAAERTALDAKIALVKDEFQSRFDSEYAKLNAAGQLEGLDLPGGREYDLTHARLKREISERNALAVVSRVLEGDERLRARCKGIPIEWLAHSMKCPEPSIAEAPLKGAFHDWSVGRMPTGMNVFEKNIVFNWQFFVVEKEKRPWRNMVMEKNRASNAEARDYRSRLRYWKERELGLSTRVPTKGFEDFEQNKVSAPDFVELWYNKAVAAGMSPAKEDEDVLARARTSKKKWAGNPNITFGEDLWQRKVKIHGAVSKQDLDEAKMAFFGRLGMSGSTGFGLELDEPEDGVLDRALVVFASDAMDSLLIRGNAAKELVLTDLSAVSRLRVLRLFNCKVAKDICLSGRERLEGFLAKNCDLGDLTLLSGCTALKKVYLDGCTFTGFKNLWAAESLFELSVLNAKEVVDLSVVDKLNRLMTLDISGCQVTNFKALKAHPSLRNLKMKHLKGGVDTLSILLENPELRSVDYLREDFAPAVYVEFARAIRQKEHGRNPERLLKASVEDRDLAEVRRLCEAGIRTDDALSDFKMASEQDVDIFRMLVSKASERELTDQLGNLVSALGYGYSSRGTAFIPTNRVELVNLLIEHGARPDDAVSKMAHPAEADFEMFGILVRKASKKVLTKLLQENIKSFGSHRAFRRQSIRPKDRLAVVKLLLKNGADVNAHDFFRRTPLGNAIEYDGDMELVRILLDNGADVSTLAPEMNMFQDLYRRHATPWGTNRYELVELLLAHKFDANARGKSGRTPLGDLVFYGGPEGYDLKMAEILLKHGADPNAKQDGRFDSVIDMASRMPRAKGLVDLLAKYGGAVSDEAKRETKRPLGREEMRPGGRRGVPSGHDDRLREEMDRFMDEMRECTDPKERRKLFEEHRKRRQEILNR